MTGKEHVFERAGLGKAPFRVIGVERRVGPVQLKDGTTVGAPGQPMGTCEYCYRGLAVCYLVRSADGRVFTVGSSCVAKAGDAGLKREADKLKRQLVHAQQDARAAAAAAAMQRPDVRQALAKLPTPSKRGRGNMLDWAVWMMDNAGRAGKARVARRVEEIVAGLTEVV